MTMNAVQIQSFVLRFLEAEQCSIVERHPVYVTAKLSPSADQALTHRPYYWSFVERTGVEPETMTCTFIFDPAAYKELNPHPPQPGAYGTVISTAAPAGMAGGAAPVQGGNLPGASTAATPPSGSAPGADTASGVAAGGAARVHGAGGPGISTGATGAAGAAARVQDASMPSAGNVAAGGAASGAPPQGDSILGRYLGFVPTTFTARIPRDEVTFGSRRLEQIFAAVQAKGQFVRLFEQPPDDLQRSRPTVSVPYDTWFAVNYKVELACDMKRSELHSIGIQLQTGEIADSFYGRIAGRSLTPRLPAHIYVTPDRVTLPRAVLFLEEHMERLLAGYDHSWAEEARLRLAEEHERVRSYYEPLLLEAEPEAKADIEARYANRVQEVQWQFGPRIQISAINCGLFHLPAANARTY